MNKPRYVPPVKPYTGARVVGLMKLHPENVGEPPVPMIIDVLAVAGEDNCTVLGIAHFMCTVLTRAGRKIQVESAAIEAVAVEPGQQAGWFWPVPDRVIAAASGEPADDSALAVACKA